MAQIRQFFDAMPYSNSSSVLLQNRSIYSVRKFVSHFREI